MTGTSVARWRAKVRRGRRRIGHLARISNASLTTRVCRCIELGRPHFDYTSAQHDIHSRTSSGDPRSPELQPWFDRPPRCPDLTPFPLGPILNRADQANRADPNPDCRADTTARAWPCRRTVPPRQASQERCRGQSPQPDQAGSAAFPPAHARARLPSRSTLAIVLTLAMRCLAFHSSCCGCVRGDWSWTVLLLPE